MTSLSSLNSSNSTIDLHRFEERRNWIEDKVKLLESFKLLQPLQPLAPARSSYTQAEVKAWNEELESIERTVEDYDRGELRQFKETARTVSKHELSKSDTILLEITLRTLASLDKVWILLRYRKKLLSILESRLRWEALLDIVCGIMDSLVKQVASYVVEYHREWSTTPIPSSLDLRQQISSLSQAVTLSSSSLDALIDVTRLPEPFLVAQDVLEEEVASVTDRLTLFLDQVELQATMARQFDRLLDELCQNVTCLEQKMRRDGTLQMEGIEVFEDQLASLRTALSLVDLSTLPLPVHLKFATLEGNDLTVATLRKKYDDVRERLDQCEKDVGDQRWKLELLERAKLEKWSVSENMTPRRSSTASGIPVLSRPSSSQSQNRSRTVSARSVSGHGRTKVECDEGVALNQKRRLDREMVNIIAGLPMSISIRAVEEDAQDDSGKYFIGNRIYFIRILRQSAMVRTGGGWIELKSFLMQHYGSSALPTVISPSPSVTNSLNRSVDTPLSSSLCRLSISPSPSFELVSAKASSGIRWRP